MSRSYKLAGTTTSLNVISAWSRPQNCAQRDKNSPVRVGVRSNLFVIPGIASRLKRNAGTQNECVTSCELRSISVVRPTGKYSAGGICGVPVSRIRAPLYSKAHDQRNAVACTTLCGCAPTRSTGTSAAYVLMNSPTTIANDNAV